MKIPKVINSFSGPFGFLSNFYPYPMKWKDKMIGSSEHAYQAEKARLLGMTELEEKILKAATPGLTKQLAPNKSLEKSIWHRKVDHLKKAQKKIDFKRLVMRQVLKQKFKDKKLAKALLETGTAKLIEGNHWHDNYFGDCYCSNCNDIKGQNVLGKELMRLRKKLKRKQRNE